MCAGNNEELYIRTRNAAEADYLLEESLQAFLRGRPPYQHQAALEAVRAEIAVRRDGYALDAFDRAAKTLKGESEMEQARALVEGD